MCYFLLWVLKNAGKHKEDILVLNKMEIGTKVPSIQGCVLRLPKTSFSIEFLKVSDSMGFQRSLISLLNKFRGP